MNRPARLLALACVPALLVIAPVSMAAPKRARLTIDVKIEGTEGVVGNGSNRTRGQFREGYTLVTFLETDGDLQPHNTKDPDYAQKMMGLSQGIQANVRAAQGKAPVKKMTQQQLQEYVQKKQAACGANQDCLMKLALEAQELMSNMDLGGATSAGNEAQAYTGDEPPRFLNYFGFDNCGATTHVYVDRTTNGTLGDTTGPVPYTVRDTADHRGDVNELRMICNSHSLVVDSKDGSFYTDTYVMPQAKGSSVRTLRGKTDQSQGEAAQHGELYGWVGEQLRHAPRTGTRSATLGLSQGRGGAIHSGTYSGQATVTVSWKLEDLK